MFAGSEVVNLLEFPAYPAAASGVSARTAHQSDLLANNMRMSFRGQAAELGLRPPFLYV
jgi:hypothetical protein